MKHVAAFMPQKQDWTTPHPELHDYDPRPIRMGAGGTRMSNIGRIVYGLCHGKFGDSYHDKRIEAEGVDWLVARRSDGFGKAEPEFASFRDEQEKTELIRLWSQTPEEEE